MNKMTEQEIIFGIDGGASLSRMRIEKGNHCLGVVYSGGCNLTENSGENVEKNVWHLFAQAKEKFNLDFGNYNAGVVGAAGTNRMRKDSILAWQKLLEKIGFTKSKIHRVEICSDAEILMTGIESDFNTPCGILIAGTGSIALARKKSGELKRFGGYGHLFGDEGSGYQIATRIFSKILIESEQEKVSPLAKKLFEELAKRTSGEYTNVQNLVSYLYSVREKSVIARYAKILTPELIATDPIAKEIAKETIQHLFELFLRLKQQCLASSKRITLHGGVFKNSFILDKLTETLKDHSQVRFVGAEDIAEKGACILARKHLALIKAGS